MKAKSVESLRQKAGSKKIIRLIQTKPILSRKWLKNISFNNLKKYMVVRYSQTYDQWLPEWKYNYNGESKVQWWDSTTHEKLKTEITDYSEDWVRIKKDFCKLDKAGELFKQADFEYFHTDDWIEAQDQYILWCKDDGIAVEKLNFKKDSGDD